MPMPQDTGELLLEIEEYPEILFISPNYVKSMMDIPSALAAASLVTDHPFGIRRDSLINPDVPKATELDCLGSQLYSNLCDLFALCNLPITVCLCCKPNPQPDRFSVYIITLSPMPILLDIRGFMEDGRVTRVLCRPGDSNAVNIDLSPSAEPTNLRGFLSELRDMFSFENILNGDFGE